MTACASTPKPEPVHPQPLKDRSEESDYALGEVEDKLYQAEALESEGKRALAVLVLGTAQEMLGETAPREQAYLDVLKAVMWARPGEDRDPARAETMLASIADDVQWQGDARLYSDIQLAYVVLRLADDNAVAATRAGETALLELRKIDAFSVYARVARRLARQLMDAGEFKHGRSYARKSCDMAQRLDDDEEILQSSLVAGEIELRSATTGEARTSAEAYFLQAYESAHRLGGEAWRNVVVASVVDVYFAIEEAQSCVKWGDRMRGADTGAMPTFEDSYLWEDDYITFLAQYYFSKQELGEDGRRVQETAELILQTLEALSDEQQEAWKELEEKVRGGLLHQDGEK